MARTVRRSVCLAGAVLLVLAVPSSCSNSGGSGRKGSGPTAIVTAPLGGSFAGNVRLDYALIDAQSDEALVNIFYSPDGGGRYFPATEGFDPASEGTSSLTTAPDPGVPHVFVWDSLFDLGGVVNDQVRLKIVPFDTVRGKKAVSSIFAIDNLGLVPLHVVDVTDTVYNTFHDTLEITFNKPLDRASVIHQGNSSDTFAVFEDTNLEIANGPWDRPLGSISYANGDTTLIWTPPGPYASLLEIRIVMTSGMADTTGRLLSAHGSPYPSDPLSFKSVLSRQVFEIRFTPDLGPRSESYETTQGTDKWFVDFFDFGTLPNDCAVRGMGAADSLEGAYARDLVMGRILETLNAKYRRDPDTGAGISGAFQISFSATHPGGVPGAGINQMCIGQDLGNLWGQAWYDPGNLGKEKDCQWDNPPIGTFSGSIDGTDSFLSPSLSAADLPYVDGSYILGSGGDDNRFQRIREVLDNWGHAVGHTAAHEIGHSVGLAHDGSNTLNVMYPWADPSYASDPNSRFSTFNANLLANNLGVVP